MNNKQKRFCDEYLIDLNGTRAAIQAGYSPKTANSLASRLLTNADVKDYIAMRMQEKNNALIASQDEILRYLTSVMRGESKSEIVVTEFVGEGCSETRFIQKRPDEKERTKAAELLGKRYGLYTERLEGNLTIPVVIKDDLDDDE